MHITCKQSDLKNGLAVVSHAISSRVTLPILASVLIDASPSEGLALSATNLEIGISYRIDCPVTEPGVLALPAKLLNEYISSLPAGDVELSASAEQATTARITGLRSRSTMKGMDATQFPRIPLPDGQDSFVSFSCELLKEAIASVAFAAASDESRPVLTGVLIRQERDALSFAAADAFSLAVRSYSDLSGRCNGDALAAGILIPAHTLTELARILPDDEDIAMVVPPARNQVLFRSPHLTLVSRLLEGQFPAYHAIIPASYSTRAVVETKVLAEIVKSASLFARNSSNILRLSVCPGEGEQADLGNGSLTLEAEAEDLGDSVSTLDAIVEGDGLRVTLNAKYLSEALASLTTSEVALELLSAAKPIVVRPVGETNHCCVIMPMHTNR
jgi:DNA polymerase-3 subunit beta